MTPSPAAIAAARDACIDRGLVLGVGAIMPDDLAEILRAAYAVDFPGNETRLERGEDKSPVLKHQQGKTAPHSPVGFPRPDALARLLMEAQKDLKREAWHPYVGYELAEWLIARGVRVAEAPPAGLDATPGPDVPVAYAEAPPEPDKKASAALWAEWNQLHNERDALREALRPFAAWAVRCEPIETELGTETLDDAEPVTLASCQPDEHDAKLYADWGRAKLSDETKRVRPITAGDLRRARDLLARLTPTNEAPHGEA